MGSWIGGLTAALWLGILTSISPCPLASNIAAISYIGRHVSRPRRVLWVALAYTVGRALAYVLLAAVIVGGLLAMPQVSNALQLWMNKLLGPLLILTGMVLLELLTIAIPGKGVGMSAQRFAKRGDAWGAFALGFILALTFCPISAALFFGSLIPIALRHGSGALLPSVYGAGTAMPVIACAFAIAAGAQSAGRLFGGLTAFEIRARRITGVVFIAVGIYYSLRYIYGLPL